MKPTRKFVLRGIEVAEWKREGRPTSYSFQRRYKDGKGDWQRTEYFTVSDMSLLFALFAKVVNSADDVRVFDSDSDDSPKPAKNDSDPFTDDDIAF